MTAHARMDAQNGLLFPMNIMKDLANCWRGLPALREETPPNLKRRARIQETPYHLRRKEMYWTANAHQVISRLNRYITISRSKNGLLFLWSIVKINDRVAGALECGTERRKENGECNSRRRSTLVSVIQSPFSPISRFTQAGLFGFSLHYMRNICAPDMFRIFSFFNPYEFWINETTAQTPASSS
jgi:hypothetical protein